jgi:hypothetical protein
MCKFVGVKYFWAAYLNTLLPFFVKRVPRKKMQVKENIKESDRCNCGRSPTGECIGCYFLTGAEFETRLADYLAEQKDKNQAVGT